MTQRQIARLACKLLAIYVIVDSLKYVYWAVSGFASGWYYGFQGWSQFMVAGITILVPVVQLAVGIWLWKRAGVVAAWISGHNLQDQENEPDAAPIPANLEAVHAVALSVMGVWVVIEAIPEVLNFIIGYLMVEQTGDPMIQRISSTQSALALATTIVKVAIGFWLIFGSPGIVRMLKKTVYFGLDPTERPGGGE